MSMILGKRILREYKPLTSMRSILGWLKTHILELVRLIVVVHSLDD